MVFQKKVQRKIFGSWKAEARGHGEIYRKMSFIICIFIYYKLNRIFITRKI
jgi:hypothetical protein